MPNKQPIVISSIFKSGTWLLRSILERLTGLQPVEPVIGPGDMKHDDPQLVFAQEGCFYSWHFVPVPAIQEKLIDMDARVIFLVRNVYDLALSMYHHFAGNIDHEIGRGAQKHAYFASLSQDEGMRQIIVGHDGPGFRWKGLEPFLAQMELMFAFAKVYPAMVISYETLLRDKEKAVNRLAAYLELNPGQELIKKIVEETRFDRMKKAAEKKGGGSHFRRGVLHAHAEEMSEENKILVRWIMQAHAPSLTLLAEDFDLSADLLTCFKENGSEL